MLKKSLKGLDKKKLKRWVLLFFFALVIPTAILIQQAYSRLKWEAYHQHQLMADELATRINNEFSRLIDIEEQRSFTDYSFLNIAGNPKANLLQRSPLSKFPIESEIAGIVGFFQINNKGELMTPLVPEAIKSGKSAESFGISRDELNSRLALQGKIQSILSQNNLVKNKEPQELDKNILFEARERSSSILGSLSSISQPSSSTSNYSSKALAPKSQEAFDQLKEAPRRKASNKLGRVDDLKISKGIKQEQKQISKKRLPSQLNTLKKKIRKEKNVLPQAEFEEAVAMDSSVKDDVMQDRVASDKAGAGLVQRSQTKQPSVNAKQRNDKQGLTIRTFESTIDPFEFSQLDSGHFVLYRNVWLNKQRYIQGLLIDQKLFLDRIINQPFRRTSLFQMSNLLVAYQGNVLTAFSGQNSRGYLSSRSELQGELLYQTRLSAPLSDLQLLFSINQLPAGVGGKVILWLSAILAFILCIGFYLMYRLGLSQINLAKQQQNFVSAVSHELKTPLTSIRMYGELLREGWVSEEKKKTYYDFIYDESERLSRLINNVLHLARMTRNEQAAVLKEVSVQKLIDEVKSKVSTQIDQAGFTLTIECDEASKKSHINVDEDWFIQIMINLVDNALKFSASSDKKQIDLRCEKSEQNRIVFSVRDYGPGIDKQQMKKIFTLFYRTENELTRETVGTGIGLALVHQMIAGMDGKIEVIKPSVGAEFKVSFASH